MLRLFKAFLLAWMVLAFYTHLETGLADNSDFSRIMTHFTSGPAHLDINWPDQRTQPELWESRFFSYWIPHWRLDFPDIQPAFKSSVLMLWYPGILLNYLVYSKTVLSMQFVALLPRVMMIAALWLLLRWTERHASYPKLTMLLLALPVTLMATSSDHLIYLSSFYAETALLVYGFAFFVALLYLAKTQRWRWFAAAFVLLGLVLTAKASHIFLVLAVPLLVMLKGVKGRRNMVLASAVGMLALTLVGLQFNRNRSLMRFNQYNSFFYGILTYSDDPQRHLDALNMGTAGECNDTMVFTFMGQVCNRLYGDNMRFSNTLRVILTEPRLVPRIALVLADDMNQTHLQYLGRRTESDQFAFRWQETHRGTFNAWPQLKSYFPTGLPFYGLLSLYLLIFYLRREHALAKIGFTLTALVPIDMAIAFLGDGKQELVKHFLFANWMVDVATALAVTTVAIWVYETAVARELVGRWQVAKRGRSPQAQVAMSTQREAAKT